MERIFRDVAGDDMEIDWMELKRILDQTMRDGNIFQLIFFHFGKSERTKAILLMISIQNSDHNESIIIH